MNKSEPSELKWQININILKSSGIIREVLKVFSIAFGVVFIFVFTLWAMDGFPRIIDIGDMKYGFILILITILLTIIFIALLGKKYPVSYELNSSGAKFMTMAQRKKKNKIIAGILMILSLFTRNLTAMGVGSLAYSRQDMFTNWTKVRKVIYFKRRKEIHLICKDMSKNILFCKEENVEKAFDIVCFYSNKAKIIVKK